VARWLGQTDVGKRRHLYAEGCRRRLGGRRRMVGLSRGLPSAYRYFLEYQAEKKQLPWNDEDKEKETFLQ
jgi:hypothetical protein